MSHFFSKQTDEIPSKIKVGEVEFSQEELNDLIGSGQKLKELEKTQGQPIDDILSSWGRRGETIGTQKKQIEDMTKELEDFKKPKVEPTDEEVTQEEIIAQAKKLGLLTMDDAKNLADEIYRNNRAGEMLLDQTNKVIEEAKKDGKPEITAEELLEFMADPNNPKNPEIAYEVKFKKEIKEWESKQLDTLKTKGMDTETKLPLEKVPERKSLYGKDALKGALEEHFTSFSS